MPSQQIIFDHDIAAPPEAVFDFFADHERFAQLWTARVRRIRTGEPEPNGLGSVREVRVGPVALEETIISYRRPELLEYTITRGGPLKNHHGRIEFAPTDGGTHVHYEIVFDGRLPLIGAVVAGQLKTQWANSIERVAAQIAAAT